MEKTYSVGQKFNVKDISFPEREKYILAQVLPFQICLICWTDGERWHDPIRVKDTENITEQEFKNICGSGTEYIKPIKR